MKRNILVRVFVFVISFFIGMGIAKVTKAQEVKPSFIEVGAAHLSSDEGVINQLKEVGYTVKPVGL